MSESDTSYGSVDAQGESDRGSGEIEPGSASGGRLRSTVSRYLKRGASSGALASLGGGVLALRGVRRFRQGARIRGVLQTSVGGVLVGLGVAQGRKTLQGSDRSATGSGDVDQTDVVDTAPDVEDVASSSDSGSSGSTARAGSEADDVVDTSPDVEDAATDPENRSTDHASGDEAADVVDTGTAVEDAASSGDEETGSESDAGGETETDTGGDIEADTGGETETDAGGETETDGGIEAETGEDADEAYDRLGEAAFDEESNSLPAPQRAFDREFLALGAEAVWGIREFDGVVVVSQFYDPIDERTDLRYVTTTRIDDDRTVQVPDAVQDHWDDLLGGGVAVESGDDLVFATAEDLESDDLLVVVPAKWTTDLFADE